MRTTAFLKTSHAQHKRCAFTSLRRVVHKPHHHRQTPYTEQFIQYDYRRYSSDLRQIYAVVPTPTDTREHFLLLRDTKRLPTAKNAKLLHHQRYIRSTLVW